MIRLEEPFRYLEKDLTDYLRLFFGSDRPDYRVEISPGVQTEVRVCKPGDDSRARSFSYDCPDYLSRNPLRRRRVVKRFAMASLYRFLREETGRSYPYGAFTGIRPTKQYYSLAEEGADPADFFLNFLEVTPQKFELVREIVETQRDCYSADPKNLDVYVGIPFCHGRCAYCSFVSCDIDAAPEWEEPYVNALLGELDGGLPLIGEGGWKLRSLYIGGGTPSALSRSNIRRILERVAPLQPPEFSFEAGRPDSIDRELLELLAQFGVSRVSVNPQSANDRTLERIGRRHTFAQFRERYDLVREYDFAVNCDLIMGLADEGVREFGHSLRAVSALSPENITVHSLALKRGSRLREEESEHFCAEIEEMSALAGGLLREDGYRPYYMYRQKYSVGNLENTGWTKPGFACVYNVDNMEETASVLAFGANAISKRVLPGEERIERFANPKDIGTYVEKADRIAAEKAVFGREVTI